MKTKTWRSETSEVILELLKMRPLTTSELSAFIAIPPEVISRRLLLVCKRMPTATAVSVKSSVISELCKELIKRRKIVRLCRQGQKNTYSLVQ